MITYLLAAIVFLLWVISAQLAELIEQHDPDHSPAAWTNGVWNGRP